MRAGRRAPRGEKQETRIPIHQSREGTHEAVVNRVVDTTECSRMVAVSAESQKLGDFLAWLRDEQGLELCAMDRRGNYTADGRRIEELLADYYGIDLDQVERERRALLDGLHEAHHGARRA